MHLLTVLKQEPSLKNNSFLDQITGRHDVQQPKKKYRDFNAQIRNFVLDFEQQSSICILFGEMTRGGYLGEYPQELSRGNVPILLNTN